MNRLNLLLAASLVAVTAAAHADTVINLNATITQDGNVFYKTLSSSNLAAGNYTATFVGTGYKASDGTTAAYTAYSKYTPAAGNWPREYLSIRPAHRSSAPTLRATG